MVPSGPTDSDHLFEGLRGSLDVVQGETTDDSIEGVVSEGERFGVTLEELHVIHTSVALLIGSDGEWCIGEVDSNDVRTDVREAERNVSRSSRDL